MCSDISRTAFIYVVQKRRFDYRCNNLFFSAVARRQRTFHLAVTWDGHVCSDASAQDAFHLTRIPTISHCNEQKQHFSSNITVLLLLYCVSANLSFYRVRYFSFFYLCMFVCILCIVFEYLLPFGIINDDDDDDNACRLKCVIKLLVSQQLSQCSSESSRRKAHPEKAVLCNSTIPKITTFSNLQFLFNRPFL